MALANLTQWAFQMVNLDKKLEPVVSDSSAQLLVLTAGAPTAPTLYSDANGTSITTPIVSPRTAVNGWFRFWTDNTVTSVDLVLNSSTGESYFFKSMTPSDHHLTVQPSKPFSILVVPFGSETSEKDSGMVLPANLVITPNDIVVRVTTVHAAKTMDVGILSTQTGGDADGFVVGVSVATAGLVNMYPSISNGANIDFTGASTYGALVASKITGSDAVATNGGFSPIAYRTDGTAKNISYTSSAGTTTAAGYVYIGYKKLIA